MSDVPINCPKCGVKISAGRERCPRCRAVLTGPDPAETTKHSQKLMAITAVIILIFAALLFFLWYSSAPGSSSSLSSTGPPVVAGNTAPPAATLEPAFMEWSAQPAGPPEQLREARDRYKDDVARAPKNAEAFANLGRTQLQLGDTLDAIASFQSATDIDPQSAQVRFELARAQCALARWDECVGTLREARRLDPERFAVAYNLGVALHRAGGDEPAVEEFKKAAELSEEPVVWLGLAAAYEKLGKSAEAVEAYNAYLQRVPATPLGDQIRARVSRLGSGG